MDYVWILLCNLLLPLYVMFKNTSIADTMPVQLYGDDANQGRPLPPRHKSGKTSGFRLLMGGLAFIANAYIGIYAPISRRAASVTGLVVGIGTMLLVNWWEKKAAAEADEDAK